MVSPTKWLIATTVVVLGAVTGCSTVVSGSASSAGSGGDTPTGATADGGAGGGSSSACGSESGFCITVDITGAAAIKGTAQTINLVTCADYAKGQSPGSDDGLQLPGLVGEKIGTQEVTAVNEISGYTGPGTYEKDALNSVAGVVDVSIDDTPYQLDDATTAKAVINADGSGSFTFTDLKEGEQGNPGTPKGAISGSFTWTCSD